jgi:small conductance mechanosensitive channel
MKSRFIPRFAVCLFLVWLGIQFVAVVGTAQEPSAEENTYQAVTASDSVIAVDRLKIQLRPLTKDELEVEANEWLKQLRSQITEVGATELKIQSLADGENGDELTKQLIGLRTQESALVEHVRVVLAALKAKGGDVEESEQYISAVTDLGETMDATSYRAAVVASAKTWIASEDGGQLLARRLVVALVILFVFWVMSKFAGRMISRWLAKQPRASNLLEDFARRTTGGVVFVVGILMALSVLGVEIGPMMAALGAGGFIVGFALQETLGSFASGLMIMVYRPFDVDDYVSIAGDAGTVKEMSLVSTTLLTVDNKVVVVPNKKAWSDTIVNYTGKNVRRVDLVFGISYEDDIQHAIDVLTEVASEHALVLDNPALHAGVGELADSSVNLFCRPWVKTSNYWTVYWDLTHRMKERFDAEGISFPFPQRDVHFDNPAASSEQPAGGMTEASTEH